MPKLEIIIKKKLIYLIIFFPLDRINNWNRLYGKKGFIQYQFVIPNDDVVKNIRTILDKFSQFGLSSFLTVLKKFGNLKIINQFINHQLIHINFIKINSQGFTKFWIS